MYLVVCAPGLVIKIMIIKENLLKLEKINKMVIIACADNGYVGTGLVHRMQSFGCMCKKNKKTQILGWKVASCICASSQWPSFLWPKGRSLGHGNLKFLWSLTKYRAVLNDIDLTDIRPKIKQILFNPARQSRRSMSYNELIWNYVMCAINRIVVHILCKFIINNQSPAKQVKVPDAPRQKVHLQKPPP